MRPALVLVDLQADYLQTAGLEPAAEALIRRTALLLEGCRARGIPVIHLWTTISRENDRRLPHWKKAGRWMCVAGTAGHETPELLRPLDGEIIVHKTGFNGFADPAMDDAIRRLNCDTLALAGLHLHTCVRAAAVEGLERGLKVMIANDAAASNEPIYAAATERWLGDRCVEFLTVNSLLAMFDGDSSAALIHRSPRKLDEVLFEVAPANDLMISDSVAKTRAALETWQRTELETRAGMLETLAARLDAAAPELARQMAIDVGKPISHGREEVQRTARNIRDVIRRGTSAALDIREPAGRLRRRPIGVVAMISPWNNPVAIPLGKIAPALIYGNTVVWKPAPAATRISQTIFQWLRDCGLPSGVVTMLQGGSATAQKLAAADDVDAVTLTGSARAGWAIQEICARRAIPLQAELNGNNAAIVWDDADLPRAAYETARGAFGFAGQRCTANRRVIISVRRFEEFLRELKQAAGRLVWGDPLAEATDIGPVISREKRDEHAALIERAQKPGRGHRVEFPLSAAAGKPWFVAGAYAQPTIVCCDRPDDELVQQETMSPLLALQPARDFDDALALCNGVSQGLAAALFSESPELRQRFLEGARAGILKINSATAGVDVTLPFGGWKTSGVGPPEHGASDVEFYTRPQAVYGAE